jgi:hypothetical protein
MEIGITFIGEEDFEEEDSFEIKGEPMWKPYEVIS